MRGHRVHDPIPWKIKTKIFFLTTIASTLKTHEGNENSVQLVS